MAVQTTPNLGLTLPYQTDPVAVSTQNGNLTLIDTAVGALPSGQTIQGQIDALNSNLFPNIKNVPVMTSAIDFNDYTTSAIIKFETDSYVNQSQNRPGVIAGTLCAIPMIGTNMASKWCCGYQIYIDRFGKEYRRQVDTDGNGTTTFGAWQRATYVITKAFSGTSNADGFVAMDLRYGSVIGVTVNAGIAATIALPYQDSYGYWYAKLVNASDLSTKGNFTFSGTAYYVTP